MRRAKKDRRSDARIIASSGNVFEDLGFDKAESRAMAMRVELMTELRARLVDEGITQTEAAQKLRVTQPRVSSLFRGDWKAFSLDMLVILAARAGLKPKLRLDA